MGQTALVPYSLRAILSKVYKYLTFESKNNGLWIVVFRPEKTTSRWRDIMIKKKTINQRLLSSIIAIFITMMFSFSAQAASCKGKSHSSCSADKNCSWVNAYKRKDGVKVSGHCRVKAGNASSKKSSKSTKKQSNTDKKSKQKKSTKDVDKKSKDKKAKKDKKTKKDKKSKDKKSSND